MHATKEALRGFIATQLNSTQLNCNLSLNVDSVCRSWRHKQKHDWLGCTLFNWVSWVELCRYRRVSSDTTQLELSWVELSCVAINTPLRKSNGRSHNVQFWSPLSNVGALRDVAVHLFVRLSVCSSVCHQKRITIYTQKRDFLKKLLAI